jgi:cytochrome c biogenesis protein CcmG, thiol:disulfide interchange protein DsbE
MQWRYVVPVLVFAALFGVFALVLKRSGSGDYNPGQIISPLVGRAAPAIRLPAVHDANETVDTASLSGKPYLINVWATWCGGCREEHPTLLALAREGKVPIVGVDWSDDRAQAQQWLARLGNPYTLNGFDGDGRVAVELGVYGAPETFLVDAKGIVQYKHVGPLNTEVWRREFLSRLGELP